MHIEFLKTYASYCKAKGLNENEVQHLKEIITVLLDEDAIIKSIRSRRDAGYTMHEKLRDQVATLYHAHVLGHTPFRAFLDEVITLVKEAAL